MLGKVEGLGQTLRLLDTVVPKGSLLMGFIREYFNVLQPHEAGTERAIKRAEGQSTLLFKSIIL